MNGYFQGEQAAAYDQRFEKLSAIKDVLHLTTQMILQELPKQARVLVVGAGTGAEVLHLGRCYPGWEFTVVEPSSDMMAICRQKLADAGFEQSCQFHQGYAEELPLEERYDAATSLLVSHFLVDSDARRAYFKAIHDRLLPGAILVTADLGHCEQDHDQVWEVWLRTIAHAGANPEQIVEYTQALSRDVSLLRDSQMRAMLVESGFESPAHVLRAVLINGWFARRPA